MIFRIALKMQQIKHSNKEEFEEMLEDAGIIFAKDFHGYFCCTSFSRNFTCTLYMHLATKIKDSGEELLYSFKIDLNKRLRLDKKGLKG